MTWTPYDLSSFELDIADTFNRAEIRAPVHLAGGNERQLIELFADIGEHDWICCAWRSHYHCLLKGVPPEEVKAAIVDGRSIALCFRKYRVISSAMVGGIIPISLGLAWAEKRGADARGTAPNTVWCFIGDMTATSGIARECATFARGHGLPLRIVVEDNGKSVATDTQAVWGAPREEMIRQVADCCYTYTLPHPHVGTGRFVRFDEAEK